MDALVYRTAKQSDADPRDYVLSDENVDRYGEVITAGGWNLQNFKNHPIALFNHHSDAIIGRWENVRIEGRKLLGRLILAAEGTSATVDEVRRLWQQKMLRAVSVGFRPLDKEKLSETADEYFGPFRYLKQELVEASLVAVPANPNALQVSRSFVLPADARKQLFGKLAPEEPSPRDRRSPASSPGLLPSGMKSMKLSDQIKTAQRELTGLRDKLTDLSNNDEPDDDEVQLSEQLPIEIEAATRKLERLQNMERALATRAAAEAVDQDPPLQTRQAANTEIQRPFAVPKKKIEPADLLVRSAALLAMSYGRREPLQAMLAANYGNDEATGVILRAATSPALMTTVGWAAELVETVNAAFIDRLLETSIYAPLSNRGARFTFGRAGAIKIPGRASSPRVAGSWVGEGAAQAGQAGGVHLDHPVAVQAGRDQRLLARDRRAFDPGDRADPPPGDGRTTPARRSTAILIDTMAATTVRPAGLLNGLSTLTPSADGATRPDAMIADIKALLAGDHHAATVAATSSS